LSTHKTYDVIVIGVGSMGSSTCYHLAKNGIKVLGLDQFGIPNEWSSHTGQSRIIRKAYFEHSDYVPLLERAYHNWHELEKESGEQVYYQTGLLYAGKPENEIIRGVKHSAQAYGIPLDKLSTRDCQGQYPQLSIPKNFEILFEPDAGFIAPDKAILAYSKLAIRHGADIIPNVKVESWSRTGSGFEIITQAEKYNAEKLIFTAGPWAATLLPQWSSHFNVSRQLLTWMNTRNNTSFELGRFPCWMFADDGFPGVFYGFPVLLPTQFDGPIGFKLAYHYQGEMTDPNLIDREPKTGEVKILIDFMNRYFPNEYLSMQALKVCMYTNSPDEHFILDFLPGFDQDVIVATGFSGHGFKFAAVIGEIMSDLAITGKTEMAIDFLRVTRFGLLKES